ncbi:MAG: hypothetical protein JW940_33775 [Polyangiaceae bacterium]|nr:hypothetical protein [Polyangiaceae bacterium]
MNRMSLRDRHPLAACAWSALLLATACGNDPGDGRDGNSSADGGGGGSSTGTVIPPWDSYCVATFTKDYNVKDAFDDTLFTAHAGEAYLMTEFGAGINEDKAVLAYLTAAGPYEFEITAPAGTHDFPFTTPCEFDNTTAYYGVFSNVSVYSAADLATNICDLSANTVKLRDTSKLSGFSAADFALIGPSTYEVFLNVFSSDCGGAESGFVSVPETVALGATTHLVPIVGLIGPAS